MVRLFHVDAFADRAFSGNPAAVVPLGRPAPEGWMQAVAAEMNLSETAFLWPEGRAWRLRWFTPAREVDLCGHATLASAHVLWETGALAASEEARFETRSGRLSCRRAAGGIGMDFPLRPWKPARVPDGFSEALGAPPAELHEAAPDNLMAVLEDEAAVRALAPDFGALAAFGDHGFIATAPGTGGVDYVCRYFAPAWGIDEDPVTGSIQCTLGPYWSERLGRGEMRMRQVSRRGGAMLVRPRGERVEMVGQAVTTVEGNLAAAALPPVETKA